MTPHALFVFLTLYVKCYLFIFSFSPSLSLCEYSKELHSIFRAGVSYYSNCSAIRNCEFLNKTFFVVFHSLLFLCVINI